MTPLEELRKDIVSIANQKGGVGKTTITAQLSSGLALAGRKVLMIDSDPQGNLSLIFSRNEKKGLSEFFSDIEENKFKDIDKYIEYNIRDNLDLIPMNSRNLRTEKSDEFFERSKSVFKSFISNMKKYYDFIIIDNSPSNGRYENLIIEASEVVIIPLEFQIFSISGLDSLLTDLTKMNKNIYIPAVIFNKAENNINRIKEYREIFFNYKIPVFEICKSELVVKAMEMKKTIWETYPESNIAKDFYVIIDKLFIG